jgi:hypothetical protein
VLISPPAQIENTASIADDLSNGPDANPADNTATETTLIAVFPRVTRIETVDDTGDGRLDECETATVEVSAFRVRFNREVNAGDLADYQLVSAGPDGDVDTSVCGSAADDDVILDIASVTNLGAPAGDLFRVEPAVSLVPGLHRLFVCATVTDTEGNPLDGNGDGAGGDDFARHFRADPGNLFANGHFDDCPVSLTPWTITQIAPNLVEPDSADVLGSTQSGSAALSNFAGGTSSLRQCVAVSEGPHVLRGSIHFDPISPGAGATYVQRCMIFDSAACGGAMLSSDFTSLALPAGGGPWTTLTTPVLAGAGAASAECVYSLQSTTPSALDFDGFFDAEFFGEAPPIFSDGFESGDTSAWSSTVNRE